MTVLRVSSLLLCTLLTSSSALASEPPTIPQPSAALIDKGDIGIAMYALLLVIAMQFAFIAWDRFTASRLTRALDRQADALWALRLALAERGVNPVEPSK